MARLLGADLALPQVPSDVEFSMDAFTNQLGIRLACYSVGKKNVSSYKGLVVLLHGYATHFQFDWFLPERPGGIHNRYQGSVVQALVDAGYAVRAIDYQGHGRSDSIDGSPCFFERIDHIAQEATAYVQQITSREPKLKQAPIFLWGLSMGGAIVLLMERLMPGFYRGCVLYAPMLSLEAVRQEDVIFGIRNIDLEPLAGFLGAVAPSLPIGKVAVNTQNLVAQSEMDNDVLTYSGNVRVRPATEMLRVAAAFMEGNFFKEVQSPFVIFHSASDNMTDPSGSAKLFQDAASEDKSYLKIGPGLDVDVEMWHNLAAEPGYEKVLERAMRWIEERSG